MSWFRNREGHEGEKPEKKPDEPKRPERPTVMCKNKLNPSERDRHNAFVEKLKVDKDKLPKNMENPDRGKLSPKEGDPTRGQKIREKGHETERE